MLLMTEVPLYVAAPTLASSQTLQHAQRPNVFIGRFESSMCLHYSRFSITCECDKEEMNDDDNETYSMRSPDWQRQSWDEGGGHTSTSIP